MAADDATDADPGSIGGGRIGDDDQTQHAREDALTQPSREANIPLPPSPNTDDKTLSKRQPYLVIADKWFCHTILRTTSKSVIYLADERVPLSERGYSVRPVVVKHISLLGQHAERRINRYNTEVRAFHSLQSPHIVTLLNVHIEINTERVRQSISLIMEYIPGPTIQKTLDDGVVWTWGMVKHLMHQLEDAIEPLHINGIIHGDIHTENLMLARDWDPTRPEHFHLYLLDFELSEQNSGQIKTVQKDILSAALMLRTILGKRQPKPIRDVLDAATKYQDIPYTSFKSFSQAFIQAVESYTAALETPTLVNRTEPVLKPTLEAAPLPVNDIESETEEMPSPPPITPRRHWRHLSRWRAVLGIVGAFGVMAAGIIFLVLAQTQVQPTAAQGVGLSVSGRRVVLIDLKTGDLLHAYPRYPAQVHAYSLDGRYLAAERAVLDRRTGELVRRFDHAPTPVAVAFSPDGALMLIHDGADVSVWDIKTGQRVWTLTGLSVEDLPRIFTPEGRALMHRQLMASLAQP